KSRRVRARALDHFRVGAEKRTAAGTGVLLYLSVAEHRAEIVADAAIHAAVPAERWGDIMADLVIAGRDGRAGDGLSGAVAAIGAILAEHFPRGAADVNELPDRVVEL
ncbi:MAG TPA: TPM domain-containing protein, partial [Sphingomonas sp.]